MILLQIAKIHPNKQVLYIHLADLTKIRQKSQGQTSTSFDRS